MVRSTGSLLVGVRRGHVIRELARALEHLAFVVGTIGVLDLLGHRLDLIRGVRDTDQITPGDAVERVARGADLLVDEVTSPDAVTRRSVRVRSFSGLKLNQRRVTWHGRTSPASPCAAMGTRLGGDRPLRERTRAPRRQKEGFRTSGCTRRSNRLQGASRKRGSSGSIPVTVASSIRHVPRTVMGVTNLECAGRGSARRREPDLLCAMNMNTSQVRNVATGPKNLYLPSSNAAHHEEVQCERLKMRRSC